MRTNPLAFGLIALLLLRASLAHAQLPPPPYSSPPPFPSYPSSGPAPAVGDWPANGVPLCTAPGGVGSYAGTDDYEHGGYFAWEDHRSSSTDIYAIRIGPDGRPAAGWTVNGNLVAGQSGEERLVACVNDGPWGAYVAWYTGAEGALSLFVQRLTAAGEVAPGWPVTGLRICANGSQDVSNVFADHQGGLQIVWVTELKATVYHMAPDGSPYPGWPDCGIVGAQAYIYEVDCCGVVAAGFINVAAPIWPDGAFVGTLTHYLGYECHGEPYPFCNTYDNGCVGDVGFQGPGWAQAELRYHDCYAEPRFRLDNAGGFLVMMPTSVGRVGVSGNPSWTVAASGAELFPADDGSFYLRASNGYVRLLSDGSVAPGWSLAAPVPTCDPPCDVYWAGSNPVPDGSGGMYFAWLDYRSGTSTPYAGHLLTDGRRDPDLPGGGQPLAAGATSIGIPILIGDHRGNAIVAWADARTGTPNLYANRLALDLPVATTAALVSTLASPDHVEVVWSVSSRVERLSVERRGPDGRWQWIADATLDGLRRARVVDNDVLPGIRYEYRLLASGQVLIETSVETPASLVLSFEGASPNPTSRGVEVSFTLPEDRDVRLTLTDVVGRLLRKRDLGRIIAGRHAVAMTSSGELSPGTYFIEFQAGSARAVRRAVVIR